MTDQDTMPAVDLEGREVAAKVARAMAFARSPHCTPEEHDDIMAAVDLAKRALSATPLSQAPAGQGMGVEEAYRLLLERFCGVFDSVNNAYELAEDCTAWNALCHVYDDFRAHRADAAQPTQDDAKRLRGALEEARDFVSGVTDVYGYQDMARETLAIIESALTPTSKTGDTDHAPEQ